MFDTTRITHKLKAKTPINMETIYDVILVDDELDAISVLNHEIQANCQNLRVVNTFNAPKDALIYLQSHSVDIIFLDIEMPFMNGFEFLEMMPKHDFDIVFTTAYDKYALKAFKTSAVEYLLKPVIGIELVKAIEKIDAARKKNLPRLSMDFLIDQFKSAKKNELKRLAIPTSTGLSIINMDDIIYCQAEDSYCTIYMENKKSLFIAKNLKYMEELIGDEQFFRVHKSYLINLTKVEELNKSDGGFIVLNNRKQVPLARSRKDNFLQILHSY